MKLTACNVEVTGLLVQGEEGEVHRAEAGEGDADAVEDVAVGEDSDVEVGGEDVVELPDLLVPEEGIRHPHLARVSQGQVLDPLWRKINVECR